MQDAESVVDILWPFIKRFNRNTALLRCSTENPLQELIRQWISGSDFSQLLQIPIDAECKIGARRPTIDHVVDICESGLGFDGMLTVGAIAEHLEILGTDYADAAQALRQLQKRIKYGLSSTPEILLYEAGFADRVLAQRLAALLESINSRRAALTQLRERSTDVRELLAEFPTYFSRVLDNLTSG